ncbi:MAG: transposase YhgA family protein [Candidatus Magnetoglobus multicellularis str. Araruama]|uniref:Transposase YhgA family protein n=1 Tax=Candidatus Magnetoglobus multicellularis str. Araruama TaxID=890399 RepID=A0A1V1NVG5_9BACT|nr:MAG: transposase YhgA family protein [Candidatus Magnetoglobus multicellularis str. Araruama]
MSQTEIINPHAMFFEKVFSREDVAQAFLQNYLSETIVNRLDLSTLHLENESFISNELKSSQADLLFSVRTINEQILFIYILLEHKSFIDRWVMLQLLGYIVKICERQRDINKLNRQEIKKQNQVDGKPENSGIETEYLEPVLPVIIYHGKAEWGEKKKLSSVFHDSESYQKYIPDFTYELINTAELNSDLFKGNVIVHVALMVMKHYFMDDFKEKVPELLNLLSELFEKIDTDTGFLEVFLRYISSHKKCEKEWLKKQVVHVFKEKGEEVMNYWIEEGIEIGILKEARRMVLEALKTKFINVSNAIENIIQDIKDRNTLSNLLREAILSNNLNEFQLRLEACR